MTDEEKLAEKKQNSERRKLKRNAQNRIPDHEWINNLVLKATAASVTAVERKVYKTKHQANARDEAKPSHFWISNIVSQVVLTLNSQRLFKSQLTQSLGQYQRLCYDVQDFLKKNSNAELKEKCKKLPAKMSKMHQMLSGEINSFLQDFDGENADLDKMNSKYNVVNDKIKSVIKQLNEFLSFHGIKLGELSKDNELTELSPAAKHTKKSPVTLIGKNPKLLEDDNPVSKKRKLSNPTNANQDKIVVFKPVGNEE